jgi:hypothetical protein
MNARHIKLAAFRAADRFTLGLKAAARRYFIAKPLVDISGCSP